MLDGLRRIGPDFGPVVLRIMLGTVFMIHGYPLVFQGGAGAMAQGLGIPAPLAWMAAITQFFGGMMILLGLLTRFWSAGLAIVMIVAVATVHAPNGFENLKDRRAWYGRKEVKIDPPNVTVRLANPLEAVGGPDRTITIVGGPKIGYEFNFALFAAALALVLAGPGRYSIDHGVYEGMRGAPAREAPDEPQQPSSE